MKIQQVTVFLALCLYNLLLLTSCQDKEDLQMDATDPDLQDARLMDFPLAEVSYLNIKIDHPQIVNGEEIKPGEIEITIPSTQESLLLSLKQFDLENNKYSISPGVGEPQDFSKGPVIYTIASISQQNKRVHYHVTIVAQTTPHNAPAKVTGFSFEKSKNPDLAASIDALKIVEYETFSENAIYILVPAGTDFSRLTPTLTFDAAKLYYSTGTEFKPYTSGMVVDFKYPKRFYLQAENATGTRSKVYQVIVDVKNPIKFEHLPVITPTVKTGNGSSSDYFSGVAKWINQGNHPIRGMAVQQYINKSYPFDNPNSVGNVITANLSNPVGGTPGVLPGEKGEVNITVRKMSIAGKYKTTAVFVPTFNFNTSTIHNWPVGEGFEGIFDPLELEVESTIE